MAVNLHMIHKGYWKVDVAVLRIGLFFDWTDCVKPSAVLVVFVLS